MGGPIFPCICRVLVQKGTPEVVRVLLQTRFEAIWYGVRVTRRRPALFRGRHFEDVIIVLCVRWYLRYSLTYRDLEERSAAI